MSRSYIYLLRYHVVVAHIVITHVVVHRRHRRRHNRRFHHYCRRFLADCCLWTLPVCYPCPPLPSLSPCLMTSSSHCGHWCWMTLNPTKLMPGGHRVVNALPHQNPSPLTATACSLHCCCCLCHLHLLRWQKNDWRRQQRLTTVGGRPHCCCRPPGVGPPKKGVIFIPRTKSKA